MGTPVWLWCVRKRRLPSRTLTRNCTQLQRVHTACALLPLGLYKGTPPFYFYEYCKRKVCMKVILQRWNLRKGRRFKIQKVHTVLCYHGDHASWKQVGWETSIQNISRKMHTECPDGVQCTLSDNWGSGSVLCYADERLASITSTGKWTESFENVHSMWLPHPLVHLSTPSNSRGPLVHSLTIGTSGHVNFFPAHIAMHQHATTMTNMFQWLHEILRRVQLNQVAGLHTGLILIKCA